MKLINLEKRNDEIASVCKVISEKDEEIASSGGEESELNVNASQPAIPFAEDEPVDDDDVIDAEDGSEEVEPDDEQNEESKQI